MKDMTKQERAEMWRQLAEYVEQLERDVETQRTQLKRRQEANKELRKKAKMANSKLELIEAAFSLACKFIADYGDCPASQLEKKPWNCDEVCDEVGEDYARCWAEHFKKLALSYMNQPW